MEPETLTIRFPDVDMATANKYSQDLATAIREVGDIKVERLRERPDTQDSGATLVLILGTTSVTVLAHGIAAWLRRNSGAKLELPMPDGRKTVVSGLDSSDVAAVIGAALKGDPR